MANKMTTVRYGNNMTTTVKSGKNMMTTTVKYGNKMRMTVRYGKQMTRNCYTVWRLEMSLKNLLYCHLPLKVTSDTIILKN